MPETNTGRTAIRFAASLFLPGSWILLSVLSALAFPFSSTVHAQATFAQKDGDSARNYGKNAKRPSFGPAAAPSRSPSFVGAKKDAPALIPVEKTSPPVKIGTQHGKARDAINRPSPSDQDTDDEEQSPQISRKPREDVSTAKKETRNAEASDGTFTLLLVLAVIAGVLLGLTTQFLAVLWMVRHFGSRMTTLLRQEASLAASAENPRMPRNHQASAPTSLESGFSFSSRLAKTSSATMPALDVEPTQETESPETQSSDSHQGALLRQLFEENVDLQQEISSVRTGSGSTEKPPAAPAEFQQA